MAVGGFKDSLNADTKKVMDFAEISAAAHALGPVNNAAEIKKGEKVRNVKGNEIVTDNFIVNPNRMVARPRRVVGLGDIISASLFVGEQALMA